MLWQKRSENKGGKLIKIFHQALNFYFTAHRQIRMCKGVVSALLGYCASDQILC